MGAAASRWAFLCSNHSAGAAAAAAAAAGAGLQADWLRGKLMLACCGVFSWHQAVCCALLLCLRTGHWHRCRLCFDELSYNGCWCAHRCNESEAGESMAFVMIRTALIKRYSDRQR